MQCNIITPPPPMHPLMHRPMHWPMNGQAYPSTPTPIPPQRYNTDWNYTILLLPYYYLLPTFEGSDGKIWHIRIEMKTLWENCISVFVILWKTGPDIKGRRDYRTATKWPFSQPSWRDSNVTNGRYWYFSNGGRYLKYRKVVILF